jgi:hypothetical protein
LQSFLKENKVKFNLIKHNVSKPNMVFIKGLPPYTPLTAIQDELLTLGLVVQNAIKMTAWKDRTASAQAHNSARQRSTEPEDFAVTHLCCTR